MLNLRSCAQPVETRYGRMFAPEGDSVIGRSLELYGEWAEHEIDALSTFVQEDGVIFDVGANIGTHALAFASRFPESTIVAFEPQPVPFQILSANVLINGFRNVLPLNAGCGAERGTVWVTPDYEAVGHNSGAFSLERFRSAPQERGAFSVSVMPIDELNFGAPVRLIKIDVEGMEPAVLAGATLTLETYKPVVYFEILSQEAILPGLAAFEGFGYELYWLETWAFNRNNYKRTENNVWSKCELGILALPEGSDNKLGLAKVTGLETELPCVLDPFRGYGASAADGNEPVCEPEISVE